jgi:hypothetical protein
MALGGALLHGGRYIVPGRYNSCIFKVWAMASSWTLDRLPVGPLLFILIPYIVLSNYKYEIFHRDSNFKRRIFFTVDILEASVN